MTVNQPKGCHFCCEPVNGDGVRCATCLRMPESWQRVLEAYQADVGYNAAVVLGLRQKALSPAIKDMILTTRKIANRFANGYRWIHIEGSIDGPTAEWVTAALEDSAPDCFNLLVIDSKGGDPVQADKIRSAIDAAKRRGSLEATILVNATGAGLLCALGQSMRVCLSRAMIGDLKDCGLSTEQIRQRINNATALQSVVTPDGELVKAPPATDHLVRTFSAGNVVTAEAAEASHLAGVIAPSLDAAELVVASIIDGYWKGLGGRWK